MTGCHGYVIIDRSDEGQDASLRAVQALYRPSLITKACLLKLEAGK